MKANLAILPGDGIGPEVTAQAEIALDAIATRFDHEFQVTHHPIGGAALDLGERALPEATLAACRDADAILLGAVGGPKWSKYPPDQSPESALLRLRQELGLYANLRPTRLDPALAHLSPVRPEIGKGVDLVVVRELTGGIYFGRREEGEQAASDESSYQALEIERIARVAGNLARERRGRITSVDKANVLATSRLWRRVVTRVVEREFPEVELEHLLVDAAAMRLLTAPAEFDVLLTDNLFGDILSDEASALAGTLGLAPSASLGKDRPGLFEPIHGSAPDIAGQGIANPMAAIQSVALLLRIGLGLAPEATAVEQAVADCLLDDIATPDLVGEERGRPTEKVGRAVARAIDAGA